MIPLALLPHSKKWVSSGVMLIDDTNIGDFLQSWIRTVFVGVGQHSVMPKRDNRPAAALSHFQCLAFNTLCLQSGRYHNTTTMFHSAIICQCHILLRKGVVMEVCSTNIFNSLLSEHTANDFTECRTLKLSASDTT